MCSYPGCSALVESGRCSKHQVADNRKAKGRQPSEPFRWNDDGESSGQIQEHSPSLYDRKWQKIRFAHLSSNPWCEHCMDRGIYTAATEVHHVFRHDGDKEMFLTSPLLSLCHDCHSRETFLENIHNGLSYYPKITKPLLVPVDMVCGAPASGKTTYVMARYQAGDYVIDLDKILSEMTGKPFYYSVNRNELNAAIQKRNRILEGFQVTAKDYSKIWFVISGARSSEKKIWKQLLKPASVYILATPEEICIERIKADIRRQGAAMNQIEAVKKWWANYVSMQDETVICD